MRGCAELKTIGFQLIYMCCGAVRAALGMMMRVGGGVIQDDLKLVWAGVEWGVAT